MTDLLEIDRRDRNYTEINNIIDSLQNLSVFPSLVWVWSWDVVRNIFENNQGDAPDLGEEHVPADITLKQVWDKFWEDADKNGFSLEYGVETLDESIYDWMRECNFLVELDEVPA